MAADGAAMLMAMARWELSGGVRLVLGAEALEHGHERAEVLQAGDRDAHRRHHLAAEEQVEEAGDVEAVEVDDEALLFERRRVVARAWRRRTFSAWPLSFSLFARSSLSPLKEKSSSAPGAISNCEARPQCMVSGGGVWVVGGRQGATAPQGAMQNVRLSGGVVRGARSSRRMRRRPPAAQRL